MEIIKANLAHAPSIAKIESEYIECPWSQSQIFDAIEQATCEYLLCINDRGEVVAYLGVQWCLDEGDICNIAVVKEFRRQGYATAMLEELAKIATEKGVKTLYLEVNENNAPAIKTYEKFGFSVYNTRKNYYKGASALCMKIDL